MKFIITESQFEKLLSKSNIIGNFIPLVKYWSEIEEKTGKNITLKNILDEFKISGPIKSENGGYYQDAVNAFEKLKKDCPNLRMDEDSYRTYQKQTDLFIEYVDKYGSIEGAMNLRSLPGFSQHHTGKAFDIEPKSVRACVAKNAEKHGFTFPYKGNDGIRQSEPWHIFFNK
jgi:LAS superfamily LD-carboxypeptidase LdcB